jgi:hypothetical protein
MSLWRSKVSNESIIFMTDRVHGILGLTDILYQVE